MGAQDRAGVLAGWLVAPVTGTLSLFRRARMFHPEGALYRGQVEALPGPYPGVARRLEGQALARLSTAWWKRGKEWLDVLGLALRLRGGSGGRPPGGGPGPPFAP